MSQAALKSIISIKPKLAVSITQCEILLIFPWSVLINIKPAKRLTKTAKKTLKPSNEAEVGLKIICCITLGKKANLAKTPKMAR